MSKYDKANISKKVEFRKVYGFEISSICIFLHFIICCYAATTNLVNTYIDTDVNSIIIKFLWCYTISVFITAFLVLMLFIIKFVLRFILVKLKYLCHIRAIYHTREKNRALPLTLEEMHSLNIFSLEEYFSFLTNYVKSTLISKSNEYSINSKVFLASDQYFDFEKSIFDLFILAANDEDFIINDKNNLSASKKIEYKKFINMLKRFNEDSDFNTYFVDDNLNNYTDESKANIFLFDNVYIQCYYKEEYQYVDVYIRIKNCLE